MASCRPLGANHWISSGFVLCSLPQFDWTGTNDISNRAYDVASAAPRCTNPFPWDRRLSLRRRCHLHSGLYVLILAPSSYAGRVARITLAEKERAPSGLKEVLVLGDSRIAEGFSATLANELGSPAGLKFVSLAEPAASANTWYYMVREVDPTTRRYAAIVVPYGIGYEPNSADPLRISMTAPLLRYGDCFHFASGFQRWSGRFRAFIACILRGSAYQDDVVDLLAHPVARMRSIRQADRMHSGSGVQRTGLRSCGDILRCSDRTGNVCAEINRSSEVGFPEELDTTIAVGHGVLAQTTTRLDPSNHGSLFA